MDDENFVKFLIRAKRATYAAGIPPQGSSRPGSYDLHYSEGKYSYIDTYLGRFYFIGEEGVWVNGTAVWGMNYYGKMLVTDIPSGFGKFLKTALMMVPSDAPYRGFDGFAKNGYVYHCSSTGGLTSFMGEEEITLDGKLIFRLCFHGGEVSD